LIGEALFRVAHDPSRPFLVRAGEAVTEVLGTEFGVRAYPSGEGVRVVVASGRVAVRAAQGEDPGVVLNGGDLANVRPDGRIHAERRVDLTSYLGWISGRLVFDSVPLAEALPELERWYGGDLAVHDSALARRRLSATFTRESLPEVLEAIGLALDARAERRGQTTVLIPIP
jgi:transmembrane sensor